jgi:hypothetical protein
MGGRVPGPAGANNGGVAAKGPPQQTGVAPLRVIVVPGGLITTTPLLTPEDVEAAARYASVYEPNKARTAAASRTTCSAT